MNARENGSRRPIAVIGAGTLGRRITLMFATGGGVVRICDLSADQRKAATEFIDETLPSVLAELEGSTAGTVEFTDRLEDAVADSWS